MGLIASGCIPCVGRWLCLSAVCLVRVLVGAVPRGLGTGIASDRDLVVRLGWKAGSCASRAKRDIWPNGKESCFARNEGRGQRIPQRVYSAVIDTAPASVSWSNAYSPSGVTARVDAWGVGTAVSAPRATRTSGLGGPGPAQPVRHEGFYV